MTCSGGHLKAKSPNLANSVDTLHGQSREILASKALIDRLFTALLGSHLIPVNATSMEVAYVQDPPSDYVAEAPEVVYHRVALFYYLLGIAELSMGRIF